MTDLLTEAAQAIERDLGVNSPRAKNVLALLDDDDQYGSLARRIVRTGNPGYAEALLDAITTGEPTDNALKWGHLVAQELGLAGGYALPYFMDPTIVGNPTPSVLRSISRVESIRGGVWQGIISDGYQLRQIRVPVTRVNSFIPIRGVTGPLNWPDLMDLLCFTKSVEEDSFVTGDGTGVTPGGVVGSLPADRVGPFVVGPRRPGTAVLAHSKTTFPDYLAEYPVHRTSAMKVGEILVGDFSQFLIADRIGMSVELVPALKPDGERGIYLVWSSGSGILDPKAFRLLEPVT